MAHAAYLLQVAGQALHFVAALGVADGGVVEDQARLVGIAGGRHFQVVEQVRLRRREVLGQALGPVGEVTLHHLTCLRWFLYWVKPGLRITGSAPVPAWRWRYGGLRPARRPGAGYGRWRRPGPGRNPG